MFTAGVAFSQTPPPLPPVNAPAVGEPPPIPSLPGDESKTISDSNLKDIDKLLGTDSSAAKAADAAPAKKDAVPILPDMKPATTAAAGNDLPALPSLPSDVPADSKPAVNVDLPVLPSESGAATPQKAAAEKKDDKKDKKTDSKKETAKPADKTAMPELPPEPPALDKDKMPALPEMPALPAETPAKDKNSVPAITPQQVVIPEKNKEDGSIPDLFKMPDAGKTTPAEPPPAPEKPTTDSKTDKKTDKKTDAKTEKPATDKAAADNKPSLPSVDVLPPADVVPPPPPPPGQSAAGDNKEDAKPEKKKSNSFKDNMQSKKGGDIRKSYRTKTPSEVVYKREYDAENKHLPKAVYYTDYEQKFFAAIAANDLTAMRAFINSGIDMGVRNSSGETPLIFAVRNQRVSAARLLMEHGARPSDMDSNGLSALHLAVNSGNAELVSAMQRQRGSSSETGDVDGRTPLMYAVNSGQIPVVKTMLDNGASPNSKMANGQTALHIAAARGNSQIVNMLLKKGALAGMTDVSGYTAADYARHYGHNDVAQILVPLAASGGNGYAPLPQQKPSALVGGNSGNYAPPSDLRSNSGTSGFFAVPKPPVYAPQNPSYAPPPPSAAPRHNNYQGNTLGFGNR